jgi:conjugative transfer region protein TrbK
MEEKRIIRLGAIVFVALTITVTAIDMIRTKPVSVEASLPRQFAGPVMSLRDELYRCQLLGENGAHDPSCLKVWAESRRRFLARDVTPPAAPAVPEAQ